MQERMTNKNDRDVKSFLPITDTKWTFVGSQKNWAILTKEAHAIYMVFKKISHYLYDAKVIIKCDHAPLHEFCTAYTLNSKVNNCGN